MYRLQVGVCTQPVVYTQTSITLDHQVLSLSTHPYLKFDPFVLPENGFHFEVDPDGWYKGRRKRIVGIPEQKRRLSYWRVTNNQQLEHVVEVLVCCILLPSWILTGHLKDWKQMLAISCARILSRILLSDFDDEMHASKHPWQSDFASEKHTSELQSIKETWPWKQKNRRLYRWRLDSAALFTQHTSQGSLQRGAFIEWTWLYMERMTNIFIRYRCINIHNIFI